MWDREVNHSGEEVDTQTTVSTLQLKASVSFLKCYYSNRLSLLSSPSDTKPRVTLMQEPEYHVMYTWDSVSFRCHINVSSGWEYLWYKDGTPLPLQSGHNYNISSVVTKDTGSYTCQVKRGVGVIWQLDQSQAVQLNILGKVFLTSTFLLFLCTCWMCSSHSLLLLLQNALRLIYSCWQTGPRCSPLTAWCSGVRCRKATTSGTTHGNTADLFPKYIYCCVDSYLSENSCRKFNIHLNRYREGKLIDLPTSEKHLVTPQNDPGQSLYTCRGNLTGQPSYSKFSDSFKTKNLRE